MREVKRAAARVVGQFEIRNLCAPAEPCDNTGMAKQRPRDSNALAFQIMLESTGQATKYDPQAEDAKKNPAAVALGRLGGLKGGKARAAALSKTRRVQIAAAAARARGKK